MIPLLGRIHPKITAAERGSVQRTDGRLRAGVFHLDKAEPARPPRFSVRDEGNRMDLAELPEELTYLGLGRTVG